VTYPEPIVGACVCEVDDKFKRFVVERLECQKDVVDQQITIDIQHPNSPVTCRHRVFTVVTKSSADAEIMQHANHWMQIV